VQQFAMSEIDVASLSEKFHDLVVLQHVYRLALAELGITQYGGEAGTDWKFGRYPEGFSFILTPAGGGSSWTVAPVEGFKEVAVESILARAISATSGGDFGTESWYRTEFIAEPPDLISTHIQMARNIGDRVTIEGVVQVGEVDPAGIHPGLQYGSFAAICAEDKH